MTKLEEVGKVVSEFLKQTLNVKESRVIKASRDGEGWDTEAEVYEDSSFIKSLGLSTRVMDRNIYLVKLNENLEVASYERKGQQE
mgnify:CR=1 FL=1